jgi:hypothetical protein
MSNKILELTPADLDTLKVVYQACYDAAIETETNSATCRNAERAVDHLVRSLLLPGYLETWVDNPENGDREYQRGLQRFLGNFRVTDSVYKNMSDEFRTIAMDHIKNVYFLAFTDLVNERVSSSCDFDVHTNLNLELCKILSSASDADKFSSRAVLSLPRDLPWVAECLFWARTFEEGCGTERAIWISSLREFFEVAHALWVLPGEVIICKKPIKVDEKIINMQREVNEGTSANHIFCEDPQPGDVRVYNQ